MNSFGEFLKLIAAGVIGGTVTVFGATLEFWNKGRELDIRMVDVALTILSAKDDNTKSVYARRYALDLLEHYGGRPIPDKDEWARNGDLPVGKFPLNWEYAPRIDSLLGSGKVPLDQRVYEMSKPPGETTGDPTIAPSKPSGESEPEHMIAPVQ